MRAGIVLISPLIPILKTYFNINNLTVSILAGIPILCFSLSSIFMSLVSKLGSSDRIIKFAITTLAAGQLGRIFGGIVGLFFFTFVIGIAVAIMNYEIPTWIKENAENQTGAMTGTYVALMGICAGISVAVSVPLAKATSFSWRLALVPWLVLAIIASIYWNLRKAPSRKSNEQIVLSFWKSKMIKSPIAWALVAFFGLQSVLFYATATWLPTILMTKGFTLSQGAFYISVTGILGSLVSLTVPHYLGRVQDKRLILISLAILQIISYLMMINQRGHILFLWLLVTNIGMSIQFPVGLMLAGVKTKSVADTRLLSTMMQSIGYLIAALGPTYMGSIFDLTKSWNWALDGIILVCVIQAFVSLIVGRNTTID